MKKVLMSFAAGFVLLGASTTSVSAEEYQVEEGDTLSAIGQEYNVSVDNLKSWNDLTSDLIIVDQTLDIKDGESSNNETGDVKQAPQEETEQEAEEQEGTNNGVIEQETAESNDEKEAETEASAEEQSKEENAEPQAAEQDENTDAVTEENEVSDEEQQATEQEENESSQEEQQATPEDDADDPEATQEESNDEEDDEASGETMTMSATAYTADCNGCSGTTADGTTLSGDENVIAVDPDKIPLGSEVHVEGYGDAVAADTGGAINGDKIDLHMGDEGEAQAWGNQEVEVTVK